MISEILKVLLDESDISDESIKKFNFTDENFLINLKHALYMAYQKVKEEGKTKAEKTKLIRTIEKKLNNSWY